MKIKKNKEIMNKNSAYEDIAEEKYKVSICQKF